MTKKPAETQEIDVSFKAFGPQGCGKTALLERVIMPALTQHKGLTIEGLDVDGHVWRIYGTLK